MGYDSRCVTPCAAKTCAVRPVFGRVVGKLGGSRSKNLPEGPLKQMLGQGHTLRLLDEARELGRHQHPGPENQDSQHMIDQPRGFFPEIGPFGEGVAATPLQHTRNRRESCDGGIATPWSARA